MNYKVLYRKYRPDNFSKVVGQDYSIKMLQNAIIHDKISHAYLFTGPRGTGKTSTAKIFAKTINCLNPVDGEACGECASCLSFSSSPDIIEIDAASNNGVDDIRELINNVKVAPSFGKYKIYIIDEVHMMTTSAFNALLLTLEEPPKHAIFIMATTNVENVPITILSRCQRFNFQKITLDNLKKQISYVCQEENIKISLDAVEEIAYLSEGGMRDALSLLDQLSSDGEEITLDKILSHYGSISMQFIKNVIEKLEEKDVPSLLELFSQLENSSSDYKVFIKKMIQELTHIAVYIKMGSYQGTLSFKQVKKIIFELNDILNKANINLNPYVLIRLTLLGSFDEEKSSLVTSKPVVEQEVEKNVVVEEKNEIESQKEMVENTKILEEIQELKKIRINNCFVDAKKEVLVEYRKIWESLKSNSSISPDILSFLMDSTIVASSSSYAILTCKLSSTSNLINSRLDEFSSLLKDYFPEEVRFISLTEEEWAKEKALYVKNLQSKYVYQFMEEPINDLKPHKDSDFEEIATNVFNRDKIEIV